MLCVSRSLLIDVDDCKDDNDEDDIESHARYSSTVCSNRTDSVFALVLARSFDRLNLVVCN